MSRLHLLTGLITIKTMSKIKYNIENAKKVAKALLNAGASVTSLPFLMAQVAHETGDFNSRVFNSDNNASGIIYIAKPTKQKNATRGTARSSSEGGNYAKFFTLEDWARDYLRIIGTSIKKAKNIEEYAKNLKDRGYYTDTLENYTNALKGHISQLMQLGLTNPPVDTTGLLFLSVAVIVLLFVTL